MNTFMGFVKGAVLACLLLSGMAARAQTVEYIHTDALGSVVAVTNASGVVVERREYEPYGLQTTPTVQDGPGYTGHVQDKATGLTYMEQRYYDPVVGRFLSVDPVTADDGDLRHFNRYAYAYNNPYKFTDPDGRCPVCIPILIFVAKEVAGEVFEQTTGIPAPTVKNAGKAAVKQIAKAARAANTARGRANEAKKLAEIGATKNTTKTATSTGDRIRDGTKADGTHVEIKDTKRVDNTGQLRGLDEAAGKEGKRLEVHTGADTKVSGNVNERTLPNTDIIRHKDLGPGQ